MAKLSGITTPSLTFDEGAAPSTPASAKVILYAKADGLLYSKDDAGTESAVSGTGAGGDVATDSIWDAAGDLAVGSGANTAARLAKGAAGAYLSQYNGTVAWNGGTSFPASPGTGDRYWRSDLNLEFKYNGTRWLCTCLHRMDAPAVIAGLSSSGVITPFMAGIDLTSLGVSDVWMEDAIFGAKLGATNTGSAYWTLVWRTQVTGGGSDVDLATGSTISLTASQNHRIVAAIDALLGSTSATFYGYGTKVSTPSNLTCSAAMTYRYVAT